MKSTFKHVIVLLVIIAMSFSLVSCTLTYNKYIGITESEINSKGELVITYEDGTVVNLGKVVGKDGKNGKDAAGGDGGVTVIEGEGSTAVAVSTGLRSAVNVIASFEKTNDTFAGKESYASAGAGVIYSLNSEEGDAYIITNYHVVFDSESITGIAKEIFVYLYGREWGEYAISAEYIGGSMTYDIAVLRVTNCDALKGSTYIPVRAANSEDIRVGDTAIAIGNPDSAGISSSVGIISVDSEYITMLGADGATEVQFRVMRIDTAVNPGNSGGGLFNSKGELIGIVNAKNSNSKVENIGYAIPSNIAVRVAESIIHYCDGEGTTKISKPLMGVTVETLGSSAVHDEDTMRTTIRETIGVRDVNPGSAADGVLMPGDVFVKAYFGDISFDVTRQHQIIDLMLLVRAGDTVSYDVIRGGETVRVDVVITESSLTTVS